MSLEVKNILLGLMAILAQAVNAYGCDKSRAVLIDSPKRPANSWNLVISNINPDSMRAVEDVSGCKSAIRIVHENKPNVTDRKEIGFVSDTVARIEMDSGATPPIHGNLNPVLLQRDFLPLVPVWSEAESLYVDMILSINQFRVTGHGVGYVTVVFLFADEKTAKDFWFSVQIWDPRGFDRPLLDGWGSQRRDFKMLDKCATCTGHVNISSAVRPTSPFLVPAPWSAQAYSEVNDGEHRFSFDVPRSRFSRVLDELRRMPNADNEFSDDPSEYALRLAGVQFETWTGQGAAVELEGIVRNWSVRVR
jgi:hypothetical protein